MALPFGSFRSLLRVSVALLALRSSAAACLGNGCPEDQSSAAHAGLLGASSCQPKDYPSGQKLQPLDLPSTVADVQWAGREHETDKYVFLILNAGVSELGGRVWRSSSYGKEGSFVDITPKMPGILNRSASGSQAGVVTMHQHRAEPGKILFQGAGLDYWRTEDFGDSFQRLAAPGGSDGHFHQLRLHPNRPDWILARVQRPECVHNAFVWLNKWCGFDLFVSQDFGSSWANLTANSGGYIASFQDFDWGARIHRRVRQDFVDQTILATAYESAELMKGPYPGWDNDQHFVISHDFFRTQHQKVVSCGNQFEIVGSKVYLALPTTCPQFPDGGKRDVCREPSFGSVIMYVSDDEAQTFTQACIPVRDLDLGYSMIPAHNGEGSFLAVDHDEQEWIPSSAPISNVYAAGDGTPIFSLALPRTFQRDGVVDFARVDGVPGVLLANQLEPEALQDGTYEFERWITTKITLNGGAAWRPLKGPERMRHAVCDQCSRTSDPSKCQLHLHGPASFTQGPGSRPSFYTHYSAPGLVMAVGNMGTNLNLAADDACTWVSSDAGLTWIDVAERPQIYEFGDQGGIIVMGNYETQEPADRLQFSLDQGRCWHSVLFSEAIDIRNIRVEPRASSRTFLVHGQACRRRSEYPSCTHDVEGAAPLGKLYAIDIEALMGADLQVCQPGDYEQWSPPSPETCLLGRNYTLHRRRPEAACFNARGWERPQNSSHPCKCSSEDLECEFGFEALEGECVVMPGIEQAQCPAIKKAAYAVSQTKKRLIQGDVCSDLEDLLSDTDGRGHAKTSAHPATHWVLWVGIVLAVVALPAAVYLLVALGKCQSLSPPDLGLFEGASEAAAAACSWLSASTAKLRRKLTGRGGEEGDYFEPLPGGDGLELIEEEDGVPLPDLGDSGIRV